MQPIQVFLSFLDLEAGHVLDGVGGGGSVGVGPGVRSNAVTERIVLHTDAASSISSHMPKPDLGMIDRKTARYKMNK